MHILVRSCTRLVLVTGSQVFPVLTMLWFVVTSLGEKLRHLQIATPRTTTLWLLYPPAGEAT